MAKMKKWEFFGSVLRYGKVIDPSWHGRTIAVSERKAYSNLMHQFKQQNGLTNATNIKLEGDITEME